MYIIKPNAIFQGKDLIEPIFIRRAYEYIQSAILIGPSYGNRFNYFKLLFTVRILF